MKYFILLALFIIIGIEVNSQTIRSTKNKAAISYFQKGKEAYDYYKYDEAIKFLEKAIGTDSSFVEAYLLLGDLYFELKKPSKYFENYEKAMQINPSIYPKGLLILGKDYNSIGDFQNAVDALERFLKIPEITPAQRAEAQKGYEHAKAALYLVNNPVPYNPINLGDSINTKLDEYWPNLTADENIIIYTVLLPINPGAEIKFGNEQEDFYISSKTDSVWGKGVNLGFPVNTGDNEGAHTLSTDGKTMYFTACEKDDGMGMCDLYYTKEEGVNWQKPVNLGSLVNTPYSDKQPSLSSDGRTLYFSSNRPGGYGHMDLWYCVMDETNQWSPPINMGKIINTSGNEVSPFIHPDNQTLYFSSDGLNGLGECDICYSRRDSAGNWGIPVNIGYPINSIDNEIGFFITAKGNKAYFSSSRDKDNLDLYSIELYPEARPLEVSYLKGMVYDSETFKPLEAGFELIDLATGLIINQAHSDPVNGSFLLCIPANKNYALNVNKTNYLFYSDNFSLKGIYSNINPFVKNIPLKRIKPGEKAILKNIFFITDSYELLPESQIELNKLIEFIIRNPSINLEIGGHTDNIGTEEYNMKLSNNRAKTVYDYLMDHNIAPARIKYKGYGESQPISTNDTEEGKALNRRTEFMITAF